MLTHGAALRFAEAAAGWLARRQPRQWLHQAIVITRDDGKHAVVARERSTELLEKARLQAASSGRLELARDIARGIDIIKGAAPIDVPLVVFIEHKSGDLEMGVILLSLPTVTKNQA